jgi:hypothetical protein
MDVLQAELTEFTAASRGALFSEINAALETRCEYRVALIILSSKFS